MASDAKISDVHARLLGGRWQVRMGSGCADVQSRLSSSGAETLYAPPPTTADVSTWVRDPFNSDSVRQMFEEAYGHPMPRQTMYARAGWLVSRLEGAFQRRNLILTHRVQTPMETAVEGAAGGVAEDGAPPPTTAASPPAAKFRREEKTWFRARLFDEDGQPMANEDYVLIDTDGARRQGKLDDDGEVYIPSILLPGNCTISFPKIHFNPRKRK
jgi:hypothetical protein